VYLSQLSLTDFRSYASLELSLSPGVTALIGPNGQGKTNLIEAIGYVSTLGSHRVAMDQPLVRIGADRAIIRATIDNQGREALIELEIVPGKVNRARINRAPTSKPREVLGFLKSVLFAPEDLVLVKGDPSDRRGYLDQLLVARAPRWAGVRQDYQRVLTQRNALLKSAASTTRRGGGDLRTLDIWDSHLAESGAELLAGRLMLVSALESLVSAAYTNLAGGPEVVTLGYRCSLGERIVPTPKPDRAVLAASILAELAAVRRQELDRGITLIGPHRDDMILSLGGKPAKGYASQGESWSYALALRLASYELLKNLGEEPILILDDVFAELDVERRERLATLVSGAPQVLVTAAVSADVPDILSGAKVDVMESEVRRVC
jgi:DNA replication and repair protein RecF